MRWRVRLSADLSSLTSRERALPEGQQTLLLSGAGSAAAVDRRTTSNVFLPKACMKPFPFASLLNGADPPEVMRNARDALPSPATVEIARQ